MKQFLLILSFLFTYNCLTAQQKEFIYKNFTQEEGLPSNETYHVYEDSKHYIWIATDLGVVRYDGNKFELFSLPDNVVFKIKEDGKGRVWFFNHKAQLAYFENEKIKLYKYNDSIEKHTKNIHIIDAYIDNEENIYLNCANGANYTISEKGQIKERFYSGHSQGYFPINEFHIRTINNNRCFAQMLKRNVSDTGLTHVILEDGIERKQFITHINNLPGNAFNQYGCVRDNHGNFFLFAGKNLVKFNKNKIVAIKEVPANILAAKLYNNMLWVGMLGNGVGLYTSELQEITTVSILPGKSVTSITKDYEEGIWLTTLQSGVYYIKNTNLYHITGAGELSKIVYRLFNVKDSLLIAGTAKGLSGYADLKEKIIVDFPNNNISDIMSPDGNGLIVTGDLIPEVTKLINSNNIPHHQNILFVNSPGEVIAINNDTILLNRVNSIDVYKYTPGSGKFLLFKNITSKYTKTFKDAAGKLWFGSFDGLYNYDFYKDSAIKTQPSSVILKKGISCIRQMTNGYIAAGIRSDGVVLINRGEIKLHITEKEGLLSNKVRYLLPLNNRLWIATALGISIIEFHSFSPIQYTVFNIGKNDGFYNLTINQLLKFGNTITAATNNGLYIVENPDSFINRKLPLIPFYIKSITYFGGDTSNINSINLPYSKSRLVIKYGAISFNTPDRVVYMYRFDKSDTVWHTTSNTELLFENLEPGTYQLQIKAAIQSQQRFSDIQQLTIIAQKPWWQNNWLRLLGILFIVSVVYLLVYSRIKKVKAEEKKKTDLNTKLTELEQTALRSQMNPHFIFNCLTSIQQLIISGNKVDANEYLVKFSRLIRKTLEMSAQPFISIREEKQYLEEYLFLEQLRLAGKFEYTITISNLINIDEILIPNMMIQPIVENCVRHGIKSLETRKGIVEVLFTLEQQSITCTITDNGVGRKSTTDYNKKGFSKHRSYGMDIVRKRLETFSEFNIDSSGLEIIDLYNADGSAVGTKVILHLPYKTHT